MKIVDTLGRLLARFRYPVSLPEDVGSALGINTSNFVDFDTLFHTLTTLKQTQLKKFMSREQAEAFFMSACIKEQFCHHTLCSYFFNEGWLEFILQFDREGKLRRLYIHHKNIKSDNGIEIPLSASL